MLIRIILLLMASMASLSAVPKVIAHRGASCEAPENTSSSLAIAMLLDVEAIEFDVHLTKDGVPIVIHDGILGRTTDGGYLQRTTDLTLSEIKDLDAGSWFNSNFQREGIPTLAEILVLTVPAKLMVEIKRDNSPPAQIAAAVVACLNKVEGNYVIGSFDPLIIAETMRIAPQYPVIGILDNIKMMDTFLSLGVKQLAIWFPLLNKELIEYLHDEGIEVWTFTVDNSGLAKHIASLGVDGIISNNPRKLLLLLNN